MKKTFSVAAAAALLFSSLAFAQDIRPGDKAKVPGHAWVRVLNTLPVASGNNSFGYSDTCSINATGTVTVIGFMHEGDKKHILVRYSMPGPAFGAPCPSGIIFLVTNEQFGTMTAKHERNKDAEDQNRARITQILATEKK